MQKPENMFARISETSASEQNDLEAKPSDESEALEREKILKGRPRKRREVTTLTISIDKEDKERLKLYAYNERLTVSDLIHKWIQTLPEN